MEPLPQASEGDEGLSRKAAGGHLTVGLLILPGWTLAHETTCKPVDARTTILAHTWYTAVWWCINLTVLACKKKRDQVTQSCSASFFYCEKHFAVNWYGLCFSAAALPGAELMGVLGWHWPQHYVDILMTSWMQIVDFLSALLWNA